MKKAFYGLSCQQDAVTHARRVCKCLGGGVNNTALKLLIETAQQETLLGTWKERHPYKLGVGLCQIDLIAFKDIKRRTRYDVIKKIENEFQFNLKEVQHRDLAFSPQKALIFCRLFYRLIPEPIPKKIEDRAKYWKKYYNTAKGAGTVSEYIHNASRIEVMY